MAGSERAVWYAGELVASILPQAASHPLFAHVSRPPEGYRFVPAADFLHVNPRLVINLVVTFDPRVPLVPFGNPLLDEIAEQLAWVTERAMAYGATLEHVKRYFLAFDFVAQCRVPLDVPLAFLPSCPTTLGVTPWVLEVEDCVTLFHPYVENGSTHQGHLASLWCFPVVKALLESPRCRAIISHVRSTAETLGRLFDSAVIAQKVTFAAVGLPAPPLRQRPERDPAEVVFLFTNSWKQGGPNFLLRGGLDLLEAFDAVSKRHPCARLLLRTALPPLVPRHREILEQNPRIELFDRDMSDEEMDGLMRRADVFLLPSLRLHVVSVVKAMAYGLPLIVSDGWGLEEYVTHGRSGLVVKGRGGVATWMDEETGMLREDYRPFMQHGHVDPVVAAGLAEAMERLLEDAPLRGRLAEGAYEDAVTRFSIERLNRDLKAVFDAVYVDRPVPPRAVDVEGLFTRTWHAFETGAWAFAIDLLTLQLMPAAGDAATAGRCLALAIALGLEDTPATLDLAARFALPLADDAATPEATLRRWARTVARPGMRVALLGSDPSRWVRALAPLVQRMGGQLMCIDDLRESTVLTVARLGDGRRGTLAALREALFHAGYGCVSIVSAGPEVLDLVLPEASLDLLFIDGIPTFPATMEHILEGFPRLRPQALIAGTRAEAPLHELNYKDAIKLGAHNPEEDHFHRVTRKVSYGVIRAVAELLPAARLENTLWCAPRGAAPAAHLAGELQALRTMPRQAWRDSRAEQELTPPQRHQAGLDCLTAGNHDLARYWWLQAIKQDPTHVPSQIALVELLEAQGAHVDANAVLDAALAANADSVDLLKLAAIHCHRRRALDLAERFIRHVLQLVPTDLDALVSLGFLQLEAGDAAGAWHHFDALATAHPDEPDAWKGLLQAARLLGEPALEAAAIARAGAAQAQPSPTGLR